MLAVCLLVAGQVVTTLATDRFTLAWQHSIEKVRWEEDYRVEGRYLRLTAARIAGSGAGMEPPDGAVLRDGLWHYTPDIAPLPRLVLARSSFTADYQLCFGGRCRALAELARGADNSQPATLVPCNADERHRP